ncbi:N-acetylmuramic acid 6-phosphate etherase [Pedobacter nyackensis]|uniref:N-acetylmuramic acid 6-phosphate etherase n=1 Tax=Pedobacter nyackensis TaxID=475255 RepID=A0A1W2D361_9SPHI|nr:N-acetylmuramic acid 6-phosphate etherase [Pedobacter nyackensis]SMC91849.1 N-acetylmuramic acid 6-phosphate etherase [Pedobacter nyackensis]
MNLDKVTEMSSFYRHLEKMTTTEILNNINHEDEGVPAAVRKVIPVVGLLVDLIKEKMSIGGRLFYIGAGTSGRLGVLDASECPPTFGVAADQVIGIMAGGDEALRFGIEDAEDVEELGWQDLQKYQVSEKDVVIGIAASGTTPYVIGALKESRRNGITTGCIVCNTNSPVAQHADFPIEVTVGPEFLTGSTRMKSGTAQKLILNMISTAVMIRIGLIQDNKMVNMQISNKKLIDRGTKMLMEKAGIIDYDKAKAILLEYGSVSQALRKI